MSNSRVVGLALVASLLLPLPALTQEKKIKRSDLPPAVEKAVAAQSQGATIRGFSEERENGQAFYEAELVVNGHSKDVLIDTNGQIVEIEEQIATDLLPPAVVDGLQAKAGKGGKLVKVESLTKHGKLVAYEAKVVIAEKGRKFKSARTETLWITKNKAGRQPSAPTPRHPKARFSRVQRFNKPAPGRDWHRRC